MKDLIKFAKEYIRLNLESWFMIHSRELIIGYMFSYVIGVILTLLRIIYFQIEIIALIDLEMTIVICLYSILLILQSLVFAKNNIQPKKFRIFASIYSIMAIFNIMFVIIKIIVLYYR